MPEKIIFTGQIGDKQIEVIAEQAHGAGGGYQVFVDRFLQGYVHNMQGEWRAFLNKNSILSADDVEVIIAAILISTA